MSFLLLLVIILIAIENSKLKKENEELKNKLNNQSQVISPIVETNNQNIPIVKEEQLTVSTPLSQSINNPIQSKQSPSSLFIIGAILIVLASIIFLSSSWAFLPGIIKTFILVALQFFFGFLSKICIEKYSLDKASKAFKYLFLAFIPIIILSLSFFELVGYFFSIGYDGFSLYIGTTFIITSIIYKLISKKENNLFLNRISVICEIIALSFIVIYFEADFYIYLFVLSIYNILIYILLKGNYLDSKVYKRINQILTYGLLVLVSLSLVSSEIISHINIILYTLYFFYNIFINHEEKERKKYTILSLIGYTLSLNLTNIILNNTIYVLNLIALLPLFVISHYIKEDYLKKIIINGISIINSVILVFIIFNSEKSILFVLSFLVVTMIYIISLYLTKNNVYKYLSYFGFLLFLVAINSIIENEVFGNYISLIVASVIYLTESIIPKLKDSSSNIIIILLLTLESLILCNTFEVLIPLIIIIIFTIVEKEKDICLVIPILSSLSIIYLKENILSALFGYLSVLSLSFASIYRKKINQYSILSLISIITISVAFKYSSVLFFLFTLIWSIIHIIMNKEDKNKFYKTVAVISLLGLYTKILFNYNIELLSLYAIGYYIGLIYITRYIITYDFIDCKFLEYYGFSIITIVSLIFLSNIFDGILLIIFLVLISFISYALKYNSFFKVSIVFIFICILTLTSKYLFQIPWYVYILLIGCSFLSYAIYDEKKKKQLNKKNENQINNKQ